MILTDRSRINAYHECPRLRYLNYHWGGTGLERDALSLPLIDGTFVHGVLAGMLTGQDLLEEQQDAYRAAVLDRGVYGELDVEALINEQLTLLDGLTRAWAIVRLPAILAEYDVVDVEQEMEWQMAPGVIDMVRCDAILRRKSDGLLFILEFKTVATASEDWARQWQHSSQLLANTLAVEEIKGEPVGGVLIEGLIKHRRAVDKGTTSAFFGQVIQQSPLCYGYRHLAKSGDVLHDTTWSKGCEKFQVWTEFEVKDWVEKYLDDDERERLFISLPPILPVRREQLRWKRQTVFQELKVQADIETVQLAGASPDGDTPLDQLFPQNDSHCYRYFGHACSFESFCFGEEVENDPLNSGYRIRIPHHPTELKANEDT